MVRKKYNKEEVQAEIVERDNKIKKELERLQTIEKQLNNDINLVEDKNVWKKMAGLLGVAIIGLITLLYFILYGYIGESKLQQVILYAGFGGLMLGAMLYMFINKTVGFKFLTMLVKLNKLKKKGYILLRVHTINGRPQYKIVKDSTIINYQFRENNNDTTKILLNDPLAKYYDFGCDIPIIDCTTNDILPLNRFTQTRIGASPELIGKFIVDASKSVDELESLKKWRKYLLYIMGGAAVAVFFGFDLYSQRLAAAQEDVTEMAKLCSQSATIVAGSVISNVKAKYWRKE